MGIKLIIFCLPFAIAHRGRRRVFYIIGESTQHSQDYTSLVGLFCLAQLHFVYTMWGSGDLLWPIQSPVLIVKQMLLAEAIPTYSRVAATLDCE